MSVVMPGLLELVVLTIDGNHFTHVDLNFNDNPFVLQEVIRIVAGCTQVSAEVDTSAEHSVWRLVKTWGHDGWSIRPGGAMIQNVGSIIIWFWGNKSRYPRWQEVIFSPLVALPARVGVSIPAGKKWNQNKDETWDDKRGRSQSEK